MQRRESSLCSNLIGKAAWWQSRASCWCATENHAGLQESAARLWAQHEMEDQLRARAEARAAEWEQAGKPMGPLGRPLKAAIKQAMA